MYKIPLFELNFTKEEEQAIINTLRSKWISTGPKCLELEQLFCKRLRTNYALTTSSCTTALHLAMLILKLGPGDEVIVPSLTFAATANAVKYVGATPVFADIKSYSDLTIDPSDIQRKITPRTKAIIPMHYGGFPADLDKIMDIAKKNELKVVEDASHAPLSEYNGKKLGTFGDVGTFSFFSNKNISTGEGGLLVTKNEQLYLKAKLLRSHGMTSMSYDRAKGHSTSYDIESLGYNYRMDDIRASLGIVQLNKLDKDLQKRNEVRQTYLKILGTYDRLIIPFKDHKEYSTNYIFPIILRKSTVEKRNELREKLDAAGIQTSIHYPAVHRFSIYLNKSDVLPKTEYVSNNLITLPMYSQLKKDQILQISKVIKDFLYG